jgi:outer membrane protein
MKKFTTALAALLFSCVALAEGKIAVFDMQQAIMQTDVARQRMSQLEQRPDIKQQLAVAESLAEEYRNMQASAQKDQATWSPEQAAEFRNQLQTKGEQIQLAQQQLQRESKLVMDGIMREYGARAQEVVRQLIAAEGIGLLLSKQVVLHSDTAFDITAKVTAKLNEQLQ